MSISQDKLSLLLGLPDSKKQAQIKYKLYETIGAIEYRYGIPLKMPTIKYDLKGTTAGIAVGNHTIRLNLELINDPRYWEDMLNKTLPHEMAHIACEQMWPKENVAHGYKWQSMMRNALGLLPNRCHQYEVKKARKHSKPHAYNCGCANPHMVSNIIHTRIQTGQRKYTCRRCGKRLV